MRKPVAAVSMGLLFSSQRALAEEPNMSALDDDERLGEAQQLETRTRTPINKCKSLGDALITRVCHTIWEAEYAKANDSLAAQNACLAEVAPLHKWQDGGCKGWVYVPNDDLGGVELKDRAGHAACIGLTHFAGGIIIVAGSIVVASTTWNPYLVGGVAAAGTGIVVGAGEYFCPPSEGEYWSPSSQNPGITPSPNLQCDQSNPNCPEGPCGPVGPQGPVCPSTPPATWDGGGGGEE